MDTAQTKNQQNNTTSSTVLMDITAQEHSESQLSPQNICGPFFILLPILLLLEKGFTLSFLYIIISLLLSHIR
jgi:hypothetical protein